MVVEVNKAFLEELELDATTDRMVCHCLQVRESTLRDTIARCPLLTVRELANQTGAGTGCNACHRHLRRLINEAAQPSI